MFVERVTLGNFRCFGPEPQSIDLSPGFTALIGVNGSGKTAVMDGMLRLFGVSSEQRRLRKQDFHVPLGEAATPLQRELFIETVLAFPELDDEAADHSAVPEFFQQMAADENGRLKCRVRLQATLTDDGSLEGAIDWKLRAVRKFGDFEETDCVDLKQIDRARVQMLYVPASRDAVSQVTAFMRSRLWRAINWSQGVRTAFVDAAENLNDIFGAEIGVDAIGSCLQKRWQDLHTAGTDTTVVFRPVDPRFQEFVRKVTVVFHPDESGEDRGLEDLSDGQRSLFHMAITAATLDIEGKILEQTGGFQADSVHVPALTLIAIEEPENSLSPFYLSRIIRQIEDLTNGKRAQAVVSSHSPSIMGRIGPEQVRHFQLDIKKRTARVNKIRMPVDEVEAEKFVREAVRTFPELYFARFVILGEGASEEVVLPRLAEALKLPIDRSFVAIVPLGGRHVNHLWRLLNDLGIAHATLLDLDMGRAGGGWGRVKTACTQLLANGVDPTKLFGDSLHASGPGQNLASFDASTYDPAGHNLLMQWIKWLRTFKVFFCAPLDLDYSMLVAFPAAYTALESGWIGPTVGNDPRRAVLGEDGNINLYAGAGVQDHLRWYRYLFLGRGKPSTHVRVLSKLDAAALASGAPEELRALLDTVVVAISGAPEPEGC
jgi:hypothetical protein